MYICQLCIHASYNVSKGSEVGFPHPKGILKLTITEKDSRKGPFTITIMIINYINQSDRIVMLSMQFTTPQRISISSREKQLWSCLQTILATGKVCRQFQTIVRERL